MSGRSEFGRRATGGEERRGPAPRSGDGSRPGGDGLTRALRSPCGPASPFSAAAQLRAYFCQDKSRTRASAEAVLQLLVIDWVGEGLQHARSRAFARCACECLLTGQKGTKSPFRRDASRPGCAGPVPCASRSSGHAVQTRCAQTWAALRPRRPAMLGSLYGSKFQHLGATATTKTKTKTKTTEKSTTTAEAIFRKNRLRGTASPGTPR